MSSTCQRHPRTRWTPARLALLAKMGQTMDAEELAEWFDKSEQNIHKICRKYSIPYKHRAIGGQKGPRPQSNQLNAQESVDLFKTQYRNELLNQLIAHKWNKHE